MTRQVVINLAQKAGIVVHEVLMTRYDLWNAEECFLTGTAAHLTPVSEIDRRPVGDDKVGPVTERIKKLYFDAIQGKMPRYMDWCTPVYKK